MLTNAINKLMSPKKLETTANRFVLLRDMLKDLYKLGDKLRTKKINTPQELKEISNLIDRFIFSKGHEAIKLRNWAWRKCFADQWVYIGGAYICDKCDGAGHLFVKEDDEEEGTDEKKQAITKQEPKSCSIERKVDLDKALERGLEKIGKN